jgi:hypothetical protein
MEMASLAPREKGDPSSGAPRAGGSSDTLHSRRRAARSSPEMLPGQPPVSLARAAPGARPGCLVQEFLLREFHPPLSQVLFPRPPPPVAVWITPPFPIASL